MRGSASSDASSGELFTPRERDVAIRSLCDLNRLMKAMPPGVPGGTRFVPGEGPAEADIAFVGEQPGDREDIEGRPFVGPAGQILDRALAAARISRHASYVTNAVKHFKFEQRGKRRLHQKPTAGEIKHYRWWLQQELRLVSPRLVVALGGTALLALTGKATPINRVRGPRPLDGYAGFVTVHPSSILRLPDAGARKAAFEAFVADMRQAKRLSLSASP